MELDPSIDRNNPGLQTLRMWVDFTVENILKRIPIRHKAGWNDSSWSNHLLISQDLPSSDEFQPEIGILKSL